MNAAFAALLADAWGMHGNFGGGWMVGMMFFMVLFWAAVILGIVWLVRGPFDGWGRPRRETPTEILERRFAEGAISADDYYRRREIIENGTHRYNGAASSPDAAKETFIHQPTS